MIPKTIHYCWFGNGKKSKLIKRCMKSWEVYCPEYKIIEWNERNFNVNYNQYVQEAYKSGKWAFVSDYCRMNVLYKHGGIYLDTDVELLKSIDTYLETGIASFEINSTGLLINPGVIFACYPGDQICKEILESYSNDRFIYPDGTYNLKTICERAAEVFVKHGIVLENNTQKTSGYTVYRTEFFNPYDVACDKLLKTENTVSIHWYSASWLKKNQIFRIKVYKFINKIFGFNIIDKIKKLNR